MEVYLPNTQKRHFGEIVRSMISGVKRSRYVAYRLCLRDIQSEYSQSMLGMFWDFIEPLIFALVFIALYQSRVLNDEGIEMHYAIYVAVGITLWATVTDSILMPLSETKKARGMVKHVKVAPEAIMMATLYRILFNSIFRIIVIAAICLWFGSFSIIGFLKFLLLYPSIILVGMSIGIFLTPFNVIYNDVQRVVNISLRPLMFLSAVVFPPRGDGLLKLFNHYNPFAVIITNLRAEITSNTMVFSFEYALALGCFGLLLLVGWYFYHVAFILISEKI